MTPKSADWTEGLFVIRLNGQLGFFENQGGEPGLSPVGHAGQCVGSGSALGQYVIDSLYREAMPMRWTRVVAAYLIKQAKRYSSFCDGETYLLEIHKSGTERFIAAQDEIDTYADYLEQLHAAMRAVLPDGQVNDHTLAVRLNTLTAAIGKAARTSAVQLPSGEFRIESGSSSTTYVADLPTPRILFRPESED